MDAVLWCGPVSTSNISGIQWRRPTKVITVSGNGSSHFSGVAASLGPLPLTRLLEQNGAEDAEKVAIMGFSAGHGLLSAILASPDIDRVNALGAFDAYFTDMSKKVKPGYLAFCKRATEGACLAVVTTSANGGTLLNGFTYPPGNESFAVLASQIGGLHPVQAPSSVPPPVESVGDGLFVWADYQFAQSHVQHATVLAEAWGNAVIAPYLAGDAIPLKGGRGSWKSRLAKGLFATAAIVGVGAVAYHAASR